MSLKITEKGCEVYGVDISEDTIKSAKHLTEREKMACEFVVGSAEDLSYPDEHLDKIVCISSLEHFKDDIKALKEMNRVLKADGKVVLTTDSFTYPCRDELKEKQTPSSDHVSSNKPNKFKMTQSTQPKVVVAIPCFNTEPFIADVVSKARKYVDQVIVIDDGSHDGTAEMARAAGAMVISNGSNLGKGGAMKIAAEAAKDTDIIVFLDGDGQHDPEEIPTLIAPILQEKADLVIGSRHLQTSKISSPSFIRRLANTLASLTISVIIFFLLPLATFLSRLTQIFKPTKLSQSTEQTQETQSNEPTPTTTNSGLITIKWITDCTSGFRAIKREAWEKLNLTSQGFQIETEMLYEAARNKLIITEAPISCNWDRELSHLSILRDGLRTLKLLSSKLISDIRG